MEIFKELTKKGYKHYYEGTIEELDLMDKNNSDLHSEIMQVLMWLYEKHGIWIYCEITKDKFYTKAKKLKSNWRRVVSGIENNKIVNYNSPTEAYEQGIKYVLTNLI